MLGALAQLLIQLTFLIFTLCFSYETRADPLVDTLLTQSFSLHQLTAWSVKHPHMINEPLGKLTQALIDHKRNYAPQALRKFDQLCREGQIHEGDQKGKDQKVYQLACVFYLLQLTKMAHDKEAIDFIKELKHRSWWLHLSSHLKGLVNDHINASYWRLGDTEPALNELLHNKAQGYEAQRQQPISLIRLKMGTSKVNPSQLLADFELWSERYRLSEADQDYQSLMSLKANLLGAIGRFEDQFKILLALSKTSSQNPAFFPELKLIPVAIDLGRLSVCPLALQSGAKKLKVAPEHLKTLLYSELKLSASWCALALGHPALAYRLIKELALTPQRVGLRYRTTQQWELMINITQLMAIDAYISLLSCLTDSSTISRVTLWWEHFWLKRKVYSDLIKVLKTHHHIIHLGGLTLLPLVFYSKLKHLIGSLDELLAPPPNSIDPEFQAWLSSLMTTSTSMSTNTPLSSHNISELLRAINSLEYTPKEAICDRLSYMSSGIALIYGCSFKLSINAKKTLSDHALEIEFKKEQENVTLNRPRYKSLPAYHIMRETNSYHVPKDILELALASPLLTNELLVTLEQLLEKQDHN